MAERGRARSASGSRPSSRWQSASSRQCQLRFPSTSIIASSPVVPLRERAPLPSTKSRRSLPSNDLGIPWYSCAP
eukprot:1744948-Prymnesium_polylepis.1